MNRAILTALFILVLVEFRSDAVPLPTNKYYYMLARNEIRNMETKFQNIHSLSHREKVAHLYLEHIKQLENAQTHDRFLPSIPIEEVRDEIMNRDLYKVMRGLPKGGNLHMHEPEMLDRRVLLEMITSDEELFEMLYICDRLSKAECVSGGRACNCSAYQLKYFARATGADDGWVKVKGSVKWSIEAIVNKTTLIGIFANTEKKLLPTDSNGRWQVAIQDGDFTFYSPLIDHNRTRFAYMKACLDSSLAESVQIVEFRRGNFGTLFYFDKAGNEVPISAVEELNMLREFKNQYITNNPRFIDFIFLIYGSRGQSKEAILADMRQAVAIQKQFPDLIRGYDLVGEEDLGHTLLFHSDSLIEAFNYMNDDPKRSFSLNFHVAETNWPDDYKPSLDGDDVSTLDNVYDSLLLRTHRIGHGLGFIKHPELYPFIRNNSIAIEVCPTSNQILGFVPDLRSHQALNYYRSGIPIVIAGDDPGSFGYNELAVDYYQVFMAWGLNLADLKEIANNSIRYSTIPEEKKPSGYEKFNVEWQNFVDFMYVRACSVDTNLTNVDLYDLQPNFGPNTKVNKISFFGNGLEEGYCMNIMCGFSSEIRTNCSMVSLNEIECDTPLGYRTNSTSQLTLFLNKIAVPTKFEYTFLSEEYFRQSGLADATTDSNVNYEELKRKTIFKSMASMFNNIVENVKNKFY